MLSVHLAIYVRLTVQCFCILLVRESNELVFGLYDQGFRMDVQLDGCQGISQFSRVMPKKGTNF